MLNQPTLDKLRAMRLLGMAEGFSTQLQQPDFQEFTFEERFGLLVEREWTDRQDRLLARRLKEAKLRTTACVEDIDYRTSRGIDRGVARDLATCQWVRAHQNVLIAGPTGVGKTFLACALAQAACRQGLRARYHRLPRLLSALALAKADGSYPKLMGQLLKVDLLVLDDWGLAPLSDDEGRELLEVIDDRVQNRSTLVASQLPIEHWHETIKDPTVADAILDRLVHGAHKLSLKGESMRKVGTTRRDGHEQTNGKEDDTLPPAT